jgi:hypothetical protein
VIRNKYEVEKVIIATARSFSYALLGVDVKDVFKNVPVKIDELHL